MTTANGNGNANYISNPVAAAQQAAKDLAQFQSENNDALASETSGLGTIAPIIGAISSVVSATAGTGNFGVGLANFINNSSGGGGTSGSGLEIQISNFSSQPLVLYNYTPSSGNVAKIPPPLAQGEDDIFLLTSTTAFSTDTKILLQFVLGPAEIELQYHYTDVGDPGRWQFSVGFDGDQRNVFGTKLQLFAATFQATTSGYPSFSLYTSPIETASGQLDLTFYDLATS